MFHNHVITKEEEDGEEEEEEEEEEQADVFPKCHKNTWNSHRHAHSHPDWHVGRGFHVAIFHIHLIQIGYNYADFLAIFLEKNKSKPTRR